MRTLELQVCTIKEKRPADGACCWVKPQEHYLQQLVYNEYYNCWDTADGDDYYCDVNDVDMWMALPEDFSD